MASLTNGTLENDSSSATHVNGDTVYVAVGDDIQKSKLTLSWALRHFRGDRICLLYVHLIQRNGWMPEVEAVAIEEILDGYNLICHQAGVSATKLHIEMEDVGEGIVELAYQHSIKKLVIGAAADEHYSEGMTDIKSRKAKYVLDRVPVSCQIWFICGGHLIRSGNGGLDDIDTSDRLALLLTNPVSEAGRSNPSPSGSSNTICEESEFELDACDDLPQFRQEESRDYQLLDQLEQALMEIEILKKEAFEESMRRLKAEKTAIEATRKARSLEESYLEELRRREEIQGVLAKEKENFENAKQKWEEERMIAMDQKVLLESQVSVYEYKMEELNASTLSAMELSQTYERERDEFRVERDNAISMTEDILTRQSEVSSSLNSQQFFCVFSFSEINEATLGFDPSLSIWEGGPGIYKGSLRHTPVAIKVLDTNSFRGTLLFQEEVDVLSKLRHPNLVTLVGVCPEACAIAYEYNPNGTLEDRLNCKGNTLPLSWKTRICIATDLCSALMFLHSSGTVHGNLKAENIFLDAGFACKLSGFGVGNHPHFLQTGELSPESDIYSFGMIIIQLLTGISPLYSVDDLPEVLCTENLRTFLDHSAGEWPFVQATQLLGLALRCCDDDPSKRPDLVSEISRFLKPIRASCAASSPIGMGSDEHNQSPSYFICPILQEVMQNPVVAADGYTYEEEALRGWLDTGHNTSPMTNLQLPHLNLVPNRTLRSAIQEWIQNN